GKIDSAKDIYLKLIILEKNNIRPYFSLLMLDINFLTNEHYQYINKIKKNDQISLYEKSLYIKCLFEFVMIIFFNLVKPSSKYPSFNF
ncbi:hypothetical protein N8805_04760, partial [Candidatus Pelagibacter ubique]|nr:hypothetical protein [Candidatus Pelagibacter ubique]